MLLRSIAFIFSFVFFIISGTVARAATLTAEDLMNMPLERLVDVEVLITGSSKYAQKISEAPSIVEVITAEDIRTYGYRTLGEALNGMRGLYVGNDRKYSTLGVRGFMFTSESDSRFLVTIDGRRMNENVYDSAYVGEEFMLDMALVDHIEYIPGPGSSIYGANAELGVINVVTKKGGDISGTQVEAGYGSYGTGRARATYGKTLSNGTDVLLSASSYNSQGPERLYFPEQDLGGIPGLSCDPCDGLALDMDHEQSRRLFAKVQSGDLTATSGFVVRRKRIPTSPFTTFIPALLNDPGHESIDRQAYGEIKYGKDLNDKTHIDLKTFYHWYDSTVLIPHVVAFGFDFGTDNSSYTGRWGGAEATLVSTYFAGHKIVVGAEFQYDFDRELYAFNSVFAGPPFGFGAWQNSDNNGFRSGLYAQDAWSIRDNLVLNVGFRLDQHHMIRSVQFNPRLGLIWTPQPSTTVKLLYGSAFRAPNIFERSYNGVTGWQANPFNKEEHIRNYEAAVEWKDTDGLKLSGSAFYNEFTDVLDQDPTFATQQFINSGNLRSAGVELGVEKKWQTGRRVRLFYNHTEFFDYEGIGFGASDNPKDVAKLSYAEPLFGGRALLGLENIFVGHRRAPNTPAGVDYYDFVNATLTADDFIGGADLSFSIYNLFDADVDMVGAVPSGLDQIRMNGRNVMLTVRKNF